MRWLLVSIGCATKDNPFFFNTLRPHIPLPRLVLRAEIPILEVGYVAGTITTGDLVGDHLIYLLYIRRL